MIKFLCYFSTSYSSHLLLPFAFQNHVQLDQNCSQLTAFFHSGLELWIPAQCLLLMLITLRDFPDGTLKVFPAPAAWKTPPSPISNSKWKDKWPNVPAGSAWFPAENVWLLLLFRSTLLLRSEGCLGSSGEMAVRAGTLERKQQIPDGGCRLQLGLSSRLHVLARIGLRRAVGAWPWWKRKEACNATVAVQKADT